MKCPSPDPLRGPVKLKLASCLKQKPSSKCNSPSIEQECNTRLSSLRSSGLAERRRQGDEQAVASPWQWQCWDKWWSKNQGTKRELTETVILPSLTVHTGAEGRAAREEPVRSSPTTILDPKAWSTLCDAGQLHEALQGLGCGQDSQVSLDRLLHLLKECIARKDVDLGKRVHALAVRSGHEIYLASHIIRMYATQGSLQEANQLFSRVVAPSRFVWTAIISANADHGQAANGIKLYKQMLRQSNVKPDAHMFVAVLKACAHAADLASGQLVHAHFTNSGLQPNVFVGNALVDMYVKCRSLSNARTVFNTLPARDLMTWSIMLTGYAQQGRGHEAIELYGSMQRAGIVPDKVAFASILKACGSVSAIQEGKRIHADILERGHEADVFVGSTLVDMYAKCGSVDDARTVFDRLWPRSVVAWNAMVAGYAGHGLDQEALELYAEMEVDGVEADRITFLSLLKACGNMGSLEEVKWIHGHILGKGIGSDAFLRSILMDTYAKCGSLQDARKVFDTSSCKDVVMWTSVIAGHVQHGLNEEALELYSRMQQEGGLSPNGFTFVGVLKACGNLGDIREAKHVHDQILEQGLESNECVGNTLVDTYAKCGSLVDAQAVFDRLSTRNVVTWTALINGYAHHNSWISAVTCFHRMQQEGVRPNAATFMSLLNACSRAGMVDEGQRIFTSMTGEHGIHPAPEHYTCIVDLLARAGRLSEAETVLQSMPLDDDIVAWTCLLTACRKYGSVDMARRTFDRLVKLEPQGAAGYALMSSMYAEAGRWDDVDRITTLLTRSGGQKKPARAVIQVDGTLHEFSVGEKREDLSSRLKGLNLQIKADTSSFLWNKREAEAVTASDDALCGHAEKLALAFGLLNTPQGTTLTVTKNLRMCDHCHRGTKLISRIEQREIIVRDAHHVHCFKDGLCSCEKGVP